MKYLNESDVVPLLSRSLSDVGLLVELLYVALNGARVFEPCTSTTFCFLPKSRELDLPQPACLIALIIYFSGYSEAVVPLAVRLPNGMCAAAFGGRGPIIRKCLTLNPSSNLRPGYQ
ncbi:hypothetical protein EYF80_031701 [Liparis tanakae]|uniref:Uncharacterized protein n=1 Tax=Liparis tanakae TaxID=230148 RepID=A0A4Z2GZM6_9TELE|nr:hypothetical protein EYF80_031701 [Liparis tanakae]